MPSLKKIHVDGGIYNASLYGQYGQGYAKINNSPTHRYEIRLPSFENTNNEAELFALLCGVVEIAKYKGIKIICSDSEYVVKTVNGEFKTKEPRLNLMVHALRTLTTYYAIEIKWISREKNYAT